MHRKPCFRRSGIAFALILAGCSTEAGRQAQQPGATRQAWEQFKACAQRVIDKPEYAALQVHTVNLDTMQPTTTQLTDETIPSEQDARLFAARFDDVNPCRESLPDGRFDAPTGFGPSSGRSIHSIRRDRHAYR